MTSRTARRSTNPRDLMGRTRLTRFPSAGRRHPGECRDGFHARDLSGAWLSPRRTGCVEASVLPPGEVEGLAVVLCAPTQTPSGPAPTNCWRPCWISGHLAQIAAAAASRQRRAGHRSGSGRKNTLGPDPLPAIPQTCAIGPGRRDKSAMIVTDQADVRSPTPTQAVSGGPDPSKLRSRPRAPWWHQR